MRDSAFKSERLVQICPQKEDNMGEFKNGLPVNKLGQDKAAWKLRM
jgi:hypothetical protein